MALAEIPDAVGLFDSTLELENQYKAQCLRIYTEIEELSRKSDERIALELFFKDKKYLVLMGLGKDPAERNGLHKIFLLTEDSIYSRDYKLSKLFPPTVWVYVDSLIGSKDYARLVLKELFFGSDAIIAQTYRGDQNGGVDSLIDAVKNSIKLAVPPPPVDPAQLTTVSIL